MYARSCTVRSQTTFKHAGFFEGHLKSDILYYAIGFSCDVWITYSTCLLRFPCMEMGSDHKSLFRVRTFLLSSHHGHFFSTYALSNYGFNSQLNMSHASSRSIAQSSLAPPSSLFTLLLIFAPLLSSWTSWSCLSSAICLGSSLILVVIITLRFLSSSLSALHFDFPLTSYS